MRKIKDMASTDDGLFIGGRILMASGEICGELDEMTHAIVDIADTLDKILKVLTPEDHASTADDANTDHASSIPPQS